MTSLVCPQGTFSHQSHRRWPAVPGEQGSGSHPEQDCLLPDEHPRPAPHHLPLSARGERVQPQGQDWRGLWPLQQGQEGEGEGKYSPVPSRSELAWVKCLFDGKWDAEGPSGRTSSLKGLVLVVSPSLEVFKERLDVALSAMV